MAERRNELVDAASAAGLDPFQGRGELVAAGRMHPDGAAVQRREMIPEPWAALALPQRRRLVRDFHLGELPLRVEGLHERPGVGQTVGHANFLPRS